MGKNAIFLCERFSKSFLPSNVKTLHFYTKEINNCYINKLLGIDACFIYILNTKTCQEMIMKFFDTPSEMILIVQLSPAGVLVPFLEIPTTSRVKASYFIKRSPAKITRENYRDVIIPGDMAPKPIDELSVLFEEVTNASIMYRLHL